MRNAGVAVPKYDLANQGEARGICRSSTRAKIALTVSSSLLALCVYVAIRSMFRCFILCMNEDRFVLTGFERIGNGDKAVDYARSWLCMTGAT
jgi:hypothetical protein